MPRRTYKPAKFSIRHLLVFALIFNQIFELAYPGLVYAATPTLEQSGFRWMINSDNTDPTYVVSNPSSNDDSINDAQIDTVNGYFYAVGQTNTNWVLEKRTTNDGALVSAFGTSGQVLEDVASSADEAAYNMAIDLGAGHIYVAGMDKVGTDKQWRIEKRDMVDGSLISGFGTSGVISSDPTANDDEPSGIVLDTINDYIYISGYDGTSGNQWRVEKRRMSDGNLCDAANCGTSFGTNGVYTINPGGSDDRISAIAIDPTGTYIYLAGFNTSGNTRWRVQKHLATTAGLCTAGNCGTAFDTDGIFESNPTSGGDQINVLQVDAPGNTIYLAGYDSDNADQWRIEKIDQTTGAYITAFGTSGAVTSNPGAGSDYITDIDLDGAGGYLYAIGVDANGSNMQWRIEKRQRGDGSLVTAWATSGVATINPSSNIDLPDSVVIDVDRALLWSTGNDRTLSTTNARWRYSQLQLDTGTQWLAAANTIGGASTNITLRLRLLLHVDVNTWLTSDSLNYKLQFSPKVGTCDTAFVGESYADVGTASGEIIYHNNPSVSDGAGAVAVSGDPTHSGHTNSLQSIEEQNNFTNLSNVSTGQDALFDFVIKDNSAFGAYCFRVVTSGGSVIDTYTYVPEVTFCKDDPKTNNLLRHGAYFCEGTKRAFFWAL